ncbi:hypothetical protein EB796_022089 [Bugula neritina]|uniref:Uncharacterized protein n=1 Tax=Bugula neritina TaxID=10212 RepID=A0A7J7J1K7_BUGNE|nr:hypothetical protein EB796_022089 [Bugula neritina]
MSGYQDADALWSCPPPNFYDRGMSWPRHPPPSQNRDYYFMNTSHCPPPQAPARYPLHQTLNVTHSTGNSSVDHMTHNAGQFTVDERAAPYWASANLPNISVPPPLLNNINPLSQNMAKSCSGPLPPGAQTLSAVTSSQSCIQHEKLKVWLAKNGFTAPHNHHNQLDLDSKELTLLDIKIMLHKVNILRLQLGDLSSNEVTENESSHNQKTLIEDEINKLLLILESESTRDIVRKKTIRALARKERRRKRKQRLWEETQAKSVRITESHERLDKWLEDIQEKKRVSDDVIAQLFYKNT